MAIRIPSNIPLGTYEVDGLRTGPSWSNLTADSFGRINPIVNYYDRYGKGVLTAPFNAWPITPYAAANICPAQTIIFGNWLTLVGAGINTSAVSTAPIGNENFPPAHAGSNTPAAPKSNYIQFDWPRVPQVTVTAPGMTGPTEITFFGTDWYGFPIQSNYVINAAGDYPRDITSAQGMKAFYTITGIYVRGVTAGAATIAVNTSNIFGLPYVLNNWANVITYNWNGHDLKSPTGLATLAAGTVDIETPAYLNGKVLVGRQSIGATVGTIGLLGITAYTPTTPAAFGNFSITSLQTNKAIDVSDLSVVSWMAPDGGSSMVRLADATPATGTTSDVRGLFTLPQPGDTWDTPPNGTIPCLFDAYIAGSNQWTNQLAAAGQPQGAGVVAPLTKADLYGVDQHYSGVPA